MTLEKTLERRCYDYAKSQGWVLLKVGQMGWPDRLLIQPGGIHTWIEFKQLKGRISKLQQHRIDTINALGGTALVIRSFDTFLKTASDRGGEFPRWD